MQKIVIKFGLLAVMLLTALPAVGQRTTIRDINAVPQSQIDFLNANAEMLSQEEILANIFNNDLVNTQVTFEAVILTDPRKSGLSGVTDGRVNRVHMFVRDTSAATLGTSGMNIQVVDNAYDTNNLLSFGVGDVIQITGTVSPFNTAMQIAPETITLLGFYTDFNLPDAIVEPVVVTTDQVNSAVGTDGSQVNWSNIAELRNEFVRVESATILTRSLANPLRPDFYITSDDGTTILNFYDTGLQFRNDQFNSYPAEFLPRVDENGDPVDFIPPPPGSVVNMQGLLTFQSGADQIGRCLPSDSGCFSILPFEAETDLELLESPPIISEVVGPDFIPDGSAPITITYLAQPDPTRTIADTFCEYFTSENAEVQNVAAAQSGDNLACEIPAQGDGVFVTYRAGASDNTGAISLSDDAFYRTLTNGITKIEDVQLTINGGPGASPFVGLTTDMNITAIVAASFEGQFGPIVTLQDDEGLAGWTGVALSVGDVAPAVGDELNITNAEIIESFDITTLNNATYTVVSSGNTVDYKVVPTTALVNLDVAEAHEGMILRFEGVTAGPNPDDPRDFGEWSFATNGTEDFIRGDDLSTEIPQDFNVTLAEGTELDFIQGVWWFTFGNYKLVPASPADAMVSVITSNEDDALPNGFVLGQNYPNPFNPTTTISYEVSTPGLVTLEVFDLLGRSVSVLVNESIAAGEYTVEFDAADLPSGMYLYRLTAGTNVETRKMMLMK